MINVLWATSVAYASVHENGYDIDLSIHYSTAVVDSELGQEIGVSWAPDKRFNYFYQLGWQSFYDLELNNPVNFPPENVSQAYFAMGFDLPISSEIMVQPLAGATINLIEHYATNTDKGELGLMAGVNVNYQITDFVTIGLGFKRYYQHDILTAENQFNFTINLESKPNRQIFKRSYCGRCYYILVGSYTDETSAKRALKRANLLSEKTFLKRHQTSIEVFIGQFSSYQEALLYKKRKGLPGSVTKLSTFSFW